MPREKPPVFLERGSYRRRRLLDGLRLMALLGAILWMIPVIWPDGGVADTEPVPMSRALFYIFGTWCVMIALAVTFSRTLPASTGIDEETRPEENG